MVSFSVKLGKDKERETKGERSATLIWNTNEEDDSIPEERRNGMTNGREREPGNATAVKDSDVDSDIRVNPDVASWNNEAREMPNLQSDGVFWPFATGLQCVGREKEREFASVPEDFAQIRPQGAAARGRRR
ncbi:unnamed protein product [Linum trigynum]|uniref:Uncharacterized protein n=1 Tax=Linum trigynum TaxID=586398 RepID=A0AAV2D8R6_9ROSI